MSDEHYSAILQEVRTVRQDLVDKLDHLEQRIKAEMKLRHQEIEFKHLDHERRLSFTEKMIFTAAGIILVGFIGALVALIIP